MRRRRSPSPPAGGGLTTTHAPYASTSARPLRRHKRPYPQFPTALWLRPVARQAAGAASVLIRRGGGRQRVGGPDGFAVLWERGQRIPTVADGGEEVRVQSTVRGFVPERGSDEECAQLLYWEAGGMWVERMRGCGGGGGGDDDDDDPIFLDESGCPVVVRTSAELQSDEERCAVEVAEAVGVAARSGPEWELVERVLVRTGYQLSQAADLYFEQAQQAAAAAAAAPAETLPPAPETPLFASPAPVAKRVRRQAGGPHGGTDATVRPEVVLYQRRFLAHVECLKAEAAAYGEGEEKVLRHRLWRAREARADGFLILHLLAKALGGGGGGVGWTQLVKAFCVVPVGSAGGGGVGGAKEGVEEEGEWMMRRPNVLFVPGLNILLHIKVSGDVSCLCVASTHIRPGCAGGASAGDTHTMFCQCATCPEPPVNAVTFLEGSLQAALGLGSLRNVVTFLLCAAAVVGSRRGGEVEAMPKDGCLTALREGLCIHLSG